MNTMRFATPLLAVALLTGCAVERPADLPTDALLVTEGDGRLVYSAPTAGRVYVYDLETERTVYSGLVTRDQAIVVDPENDQVKVGDRVVFEKGLNQGNQHRIFFDAGAVPATVERVERTERIEVDVD